MTSKQSKRERRETARRAKQRRSRVIWAVAMAAVAVILAIGGFTIGGGATDEAASPAPDFELANTNGQTVKLSDYRGQPVAVTFMHTW